MKAYVCNKCGIIVVGEKNMKEMTRVDLATDEVGKYNELHICNKCMKKFILFVNLSVKEVE